MTRSNVVQQPMMKALRPAMVHTHFWLRGANSDNDSNNSDNSDNDSNNSDNDSNNSDNDSNNSDTCDNNSNNSKNSDNDSKNSDNDSNNSNNSDNSDNHSNNHSNSNIEDEEVTVHIRLRLMRLVTSDGPPHECHVMSAEAQALPMGHFGIAAHSPLIARAVDKHHCLQCHHP